MQAITLTERVVDWRSELRLDRHARLVQNVALAGRDSRNGYHYTEAALRTALPLYDHKPVFLDHARDRSHPRDRSTRDLVGSIVNPRYEDGRIRGDIHVLDTDSGRTFLALIEADAPGVGMSHVVLARRSADGQSVEAIEDVVSVDAVVNPATTTTFRESSQPDSSEADPSENAAHDLATGEDAGDAAAAPECIASSGATSEQLQAEMVRLTLERDQYRSALDRMQSEREQDVRQQRRDALLSESRLPEHALTPLFLQLLDAAPDEDARRALIRERSELLNRSARLSPSSAPRRDEPLRASAATTADFLAAIHRR